MPIWLEAILGLLAITPCVAACWREDALVAWESRVTKRYNGGERKNHHGKAKSLTGKRP